MSLYKAPETTLYFKVISQKENPTKLKESRQARVLSKKHDLLCIKDVVSIFESQQQSKADQTQQKQTKTNLDSQGRTRSQQQKLLNNSADRSQGSFALDKKTQHSIYSTFIVSSEQEKESMKLTREVSQQMKQDVASFIKQNTINGAHIECNKVKELLGSLKKGQINRAMYRDEVINGQPGGDKFSKTSMNQTLVGLGQVRRSKRGGHRRFKSDSMFGISRERREIVMGHKAQSPPPGQYQVSYAFVDPKAQMAKILQVADPQRFDYSKPETLLWKPDTFDEEKVTTINHKCGKCFKKSYIGQQNIVCDHRQSSPEKSRPYNSNYEIQNKTLANRTIDHHLSISPMAKNSLSQKQQKTYTSTIQSFHESPSMTSISMATAGTLNFGVQTSRKPITEGFLNPHAERFNLPQGQFPEIITKFKHSPKVTLKSKSRRDSKNFKTNFTGFLHYQAEIPQHYPNQPGAKDKPISPLNKTKLNSKQIDRILQSSQSRKPPAEAQVKSNEITSMNFSIKEQ